MRSDATAEGTLSHFFGNILQWLDPPTHQCDLTALGADTPHDGGTEASGGRKRRVQPCNSS